MRALTRTNRWLVTVSTAAIVFSLASPSFAQSDEGVSDNRRRADEIIVTATRRDTSIQEVPQSIQAISGDVLDDLALSNVEDVTLLVPNLNLDTARKFGGVFNIRGVGALSEGFSQFSTVGLYIDETPISDGFANFDAALFDIDRIEVLKGPQGTLYGEGSLGGTIRIITNQPDTSAFSGKAFGRYEFTKEGDPSYRFASAVNIPFVEDVAALRVTASYDKQGGFYDSAPFPAGSPISEDTNESDSAYVKAAIKVTPTERLTLSPSFIYQRSEIDSGTLDAINLPDLTGFANGPDDFEEELFIYALEAEYDFSWATLTSSTSYYDREFSSVDDDIITNAILSVLIAPTPATTQFFDRSVKAFTQEIRLASSGDGPFDWLVGGFYRKRKFDELVTIDSDVIGLVTGGDTRVFLQDNQAEFEQFAAFGELNYHLTDNFILTGGLRWFNEDITSDVDFGTFSVITFGFVETSREPSSSEDDILLKFAASYFPIEDVMLYAQYSEGYRPGGVNDRVLDILGVLTPEQVAGLLTFDQDQTANYEIGLKSQWFDNRLTFNVAGFFIEWDDIQIDQDIPGVPGPLLTVNASKGRSIGAEVELTANITEGLDMGLFFGYSDAEISEETISASGVIPDGARLPHTPKVSASLFAEYTQPIVSGIDARFRLDARHVGNRIAQVDVVGNPGDRLDGYQTIDLLAGLEGDVWSASVYVKNLTDERAELDAFLFGDDFLGDTLASYARNRPRVVGVQVQLDF